MTDMELTVMVLSGVLGGLVAVALFLLAKRWRRGADARRRWSRFLDWRDMQAECALGDELRFQLWSEDMRALACALVENLVWKRGRAFHNSTHVFVSETLRYKGRDWPLVRDAFGACGWAVEFMKSANGAETFYVFRVDDKPVPPPINRSTKQALL